METKILVAVMSPYLEGNDPGAHLRPFGLMHRLRPELRMAFKVLSVRRQDHILALSQAARAGGLPLLSDETRDLRKSLDRSRQPLLDNHIGIQRRLRSLGPVGLRLGLHRTHPQENEP